MRKDMIETISKIARECGAVMLSAHSGTIESETKSGFRDLVTEFDKKIQKYAVERLSAAYPGAHFICEEGDSSHESADGLTFIIDPIDGTANFTHHYGHSCISIACTRGGTPECAAIYDPFRDELFTAQKGRGALLNDEPIHIAEGELSESLVLFGTSPYNMELVDETLNKLRSIYGCCQDIRRSGSAALDLCYVAAGRAGLFFELELSLWDYAAGALIVEEAGGICLTTDGKSLQYTRPVKSPVIAGSSARIWESGLCSKSSC